MAATPKNTAWKHLRWLALLPLPLFWCLFAHFGWLDFQELENKTLDWRFRWRGERPAPVKIVYVDIDSESLDLIGNWPWSRGILAKTCAALVQSAGVKAIGIDIVMSDVAQAEIADRKKLVTGNLELAAFLRKNPPLVLAACYAADVFRDKRNVESVRSLSLVAHETRPLDQIEAPELPSFEVGRQTPWGPPLVGLIDTYHGGTRWVPLFAPSNITTYNHMAVELVRLYLGIERDGVRFSADRLEFVRPEGTVALRAPLTEKQLLEINWFSRWISPLNKRDSFATVYLNALALASEDPKERQAAQAYFADPLWKDAIVLVGPVDKVMQDLAPTPFDADPVPRVGVHGNLVKTLTAGEFLRRLPPWANIALTFALTFLLAGLAVSGGARSALYKGLAVLLAAGYVAAAFELFRRHHLVLPLNAPLGAAFTTSFAGLIWQIVEEQRQKGRIKGMFGAYVSPQLVERMVESGDDPQLGGHDAEITAYFSDIQSFSSFSEKLGSGPLVELMNEYLTACTDIVQEEGGTLDKYIGDAVVAMFGAPIALPDHAYRACVASQRVHRQLAELRAKWAGEGRKWPEIVWRMQSRIGLNSGVCMIGNMGSRTRFNYTMMGDNVNLAARMESGAKSWGAYTMCTEATRALCVQHGGDRLVFRPLGRIVVKGRTQAVPIFEIVGLKEHVTASAHECIGLFAAGLEKYYARDWDGARALFTQSQRLEPNIPGQTPGVVSNPSLVYLDIAAHYRDDPPPPDWDGVYVMKEK
ncbi:MAG: adenylate/guanylate cyclase domain-containing protein [Opitutae bacterium]|nr:adenylate/guanylate cyclase domain-containing protein [Opitutae bacterium]